jgi:SLT domain-containing protein
VPGFGNIYDGYHQLLAFFNNRTWRRDLPYGTRGWGPRGGRKFGTGGLINTEGLYQLAEEGYPEMVIPLHPNRRTDAMKLLALTGKMLGVDDPKGNKRPNRLPNVSNSNQSSKVDKLEKSIELLTTMMGKLMEGDDEPTTINVYLDSDKVGQGVSDAVDKKQMSKTDIQMLMNGMRLNSN